MGKFKLTPAKVEEARGLRENGETYREIGKKLGVSGTRVRLYLNPGERAKLNEHQRKYRSTPEVRAKANTASREYLRTPKGAVKAKEYRSIPEVRAKINARVRERVRKQRTALITLLGGKCTGCGLEDKRVLQVNHLEGNGREDYQKYGNQGLYRAILSGERPAKDFNLLCGNCNQIYEYEQGRRKTGSPRYKLKLKIIQLLGGECTQCRNTDPCILQVNHLNGGGRKEYKKYEDRIRFYHAILSGERSTEDLDIRCANCNLLYEYEQGRIGVTQSINSLKRVI